VTTCQANTAEKILGAAKRIQSRDRKQGLGQGLTMNRRQDREVPARSEGLVFSTWRSVSTFGAWLRLAKPHPRSQKAQTT